MNRLGRRVFGILLAPVVFMAALSSGSYSMSAYANEQIEDILVPEEEPDGSEEDQPPMLGASYDANNSSYDVCFYIRENSLSGNYIDADIPWGSI